jgi:hypothetical protein
LELAHPLRLHREVATDFLDLAFDSTGNSARPIL